MANVLKDVEKTHLQHDNMTDPMFLTVAGKVSERLDAFDKLEDWFKVLEQAQKKADAMHADASKRVRKF